MNAAQMKQRIDQILQAHLPGAAALVPSSATAGKLYEAYVLGLLARDLRHRENLQLLLVGGSTLVLKTGGGPINQAYPHIQVYRAGVHIGTIWTDIYFSTLSYLRTGVGRFITSGEFHELDIVMTRPGTRGRPTPLDLLLGVECKNTSTYEKKHLREILGVRRELSYLSGNGPTAFTHWPRSNVPANPPSCLLVYATDANVLNFAVPGDVFGINFFHEPL